MKQFLANRWFLLVLLGVLAMGFGFGERLGPWFELVPTGWVVAATMFVMALPLELKTMWRAFRQPGPTLLAVAINMFVMPPVAYLCAPLLGGELGAGLIIMATLPCTMASVTVWTRRAGGNDAIATLVTIITNLGCFLITPAWLKLLTDTETTLPLGELVLRLFQLVVLPIVLAQLLRLSRPIARKAATHAKGLGVLAQCGILAIVAQGAVGSGFELARTEQGLPVVLWLTMIFLVVAIHLAMLWLGFYGARLLGMARPEQIAVGFGGSQKTLMVGLDLGLTYYGSLSILPMVAFHVCQLLIDTVVADRLRNQAPSESQPPDSQPSDTSNAP